MLDAIVAVLTAICPFVRLCLPLKHGVYTADGLASPTQTLEAHELTTTNLIHSSPIFMMTLATEGVGVITLVRLLRACRARPLCRPCETRRRRATVKPIGWQRHGRDGVGHTDDNLLKAFMSVWPALISFTSADRTVLSDTDGFVAII